MKGFPDLPPLWLVLGLVLNWGLARALPGFDPGDFGRLASWVLIGAGLGLIGWAAIWFWRRKTTIEPHHEAQHLIIEGPFRFSRNPIYLAMVVILLGAVIGRGQPLGLMLVVGLWFVLDRRFARPEEDGLRASFGEEAERYIDGTKRWI